MRPLQWGIEAVERGWVPDTLVRMAIRRLCSERVIEARSAVGREYGGSDPDFAKTLRRGPIALVPELANRQHYEVPADFFEKVLGPRRKYSCCYFPEATTTLADAELAALELTCEHAELRDGHSILELGCGWGSLSLFMAERFPKSEILAISNSTSQRLTIEQLAKERGLRNLKIETVDMNEFDPGGRTFDRVVSVEMFEHLRNYELLFQRIASWLRPAGKLMTHVFCHRSLTYPFETAGDSNWMGQHFFTGGLMPAANLFQKFPKHLVVTQTHEWSGLHYQRTAEAWLQRLDAQRHDIQPILQRTYGVAEAGRWFQRWRMFFLAVSELFGYAGGQEWFVTHYLMEQAHGMPGDLRAGVGLDLCQEARVS